MEIQYDDFPSSNMTNFSLDWTTTSATNNTTRSPTYLLTFNIAKWINGFIIILGFITNSLILVILSRKRIGSQTTRIILIFLAATDLSVMFIELFVHYIPYYWRWFEVFTTDFGCGIAFHIQGSAITASSWYIMLMTIERFTVVWFPMKAKIICTQKKILVACIMIPILCLIIYCFWLIDIGVYPEGVDGYNICMPKKYHTVDQSASITIKTKIQIWITLYFFIPAILIVILNTGIVVRLSQASKLQKVMRGSVKSRNGSASKSSAPGPVSRRMSRQASQTSNSPSSIKKATTLVIAASVTFVVLMIPRGVITTASMNAKWSYDSDGWFIADVIAYQLQYLNHACNFFLYVLANNSFRKEMKRILTCPSRRPRSGIHRGQGSYIDTDDTQMTYVRPNSSNYSLRNVYHGCPDDSPECVQLVNNNNHSNPSSPTPTTSLQLDGSSGLHQPSPLS